MKPKFLLLIVVIVTLLVALSAVALARPGVDYMKLWRLPWQETPDPTPGPIPG